jgi:hypothetical protein
MRSAEADALRATLPAPFNSQEIDRTRSRDQRVRLQVTRFGVGVTPHPRSSSRRADTMSARFERTPRHHERLQRVRKGAPMEYVEHAEPRPERISIERCRELLGEDAESMSDQDIENIRRHAETMACIVVEMYQEQCRASE